MSWLPDVFGTIAFEYTAEGLSVFFSSHVLSEVERLSHASAQGGKRGARLTGRSE